MNRNKDSGFTLIELVVVITILGILAAFAVPKFVALDQQARISTVNALAGSIKSAAALARGMSMATGSQTSVIMEGTTVNLTNQYPAATATGIEAAVNANYGATGDFTFTAGTPASFQRNGAPTPTACVVNYTAAVSGTNGVTPPTVAVITTGC
jgi:MSHA pilin protein MshA